MKLEGSLDAFSLPDIFQLLSFTKKSGGLHLASDGSDGVVFFAGGQVTGASADGTRQPLARRLIGAGVVDDDALRAAVQAAGEGESVGVVKALLDHGVIEAGLVQQAVNAQSVDAVFDLLRWEEGDFAFVMDEANPDDVGVTLSIEDILADAESRRGSWESVSQIVPTSQSVLAMPVVLPTDPQVSREEWSLLALVDGRRTVAELVDLTGSGHYAVVSTLAGLVTRGLLEVRDGEVDDHVSVVVRRQALLAELEGAPFQPIRSGAVAPEAKDETHDETHDEPEDEPERERRRSERRRSDRRQADSTPALEPGPDEDSTEPPALAVADEDDVPAAPAEATALGGAHVPGDVVPPRPEPFLPKRQADFDEFTPSPATRPVHVRSGGPGSGAPMGSAAVALDPEVAAVIERDPNVNRSLMLRLIAGVRGL